MPVYLRRFIFSELKQHYDEEKAAHEKASGKQSSSKNQQQTVAWNPTQTKAPVKYQ
jgi:hypothetical protein